LGKLSASGTFYQILVLCFLIVLPDPASAQKYYQIDTLRANYLEVELLTADGKNKVDIMNELSLMYAWLNRERSQTLVEESIKLSEQIGYLRGLGEAHYAYARQYFFHGESAKATEQFYKALEYFEEISDSSLIAMTNVSIATNYLFGKKDPGGFYDYGLKGLGYYERASNLNEMAKIYIGIGGTVTNMFDNPREGLRWIEKFLKINDMVEISNIERAVGIAIAGDAYHELGDTRKAIDYYLLSRKIYDESIVEEKAVKAQNTSTLGMYYGFYGMTDSALYWFDEAMRLSESITYLYALASANIKKGEHLYSLGEYEKAVACFEQAIRAGIKISTTGSFFEKQEYSGMIAWSYEIYQPLSKDFKKRRGHNWLIEAYHGLSESFSKLGEHAKALEAYKMEIAYADSSYMYETERNLDELKAQFETERKDQQILLLSQQNELSELRMQQNRYFLAGLAGLIILMLAVVYVMIKQNKLRSEQQALVLEQKLLRSQMNPHFIFNALSNISNLIEKRENQTASRYLTKFSRLVRYILESTRIDFVILEEEISNLENYLAIQKLRLDDKLEYRIEIDDDIDPEEVSVPSMFIQPFVENAIEYGIMPKEDKGHLDIMITRINGFLECRVDDDGIGRDKAMELKGPGHKSLATSITRERLEALNKKLKKNVTLEVIDLKTEEGISLGTRVRIGIPITED